MNDYNLGGWAWYPIAISVLAACIGGIAIADSYKYPEQETLGAAWAWTLVLVFFFALLAIILRRSQRSYDRKNRDRQIAFQPTVEKYQAAIDLWATLYFCGRDAIVFTPTTPPKTAPFTQMHQFLKREVGVS
ncbi:MAG TPA: hypothetical protein DGG94_10125 [Micromonosporaceae bacterium]|nr:hypothetical protein [Micromonosporaceae bacterium]HCU50139.1 hypothetical protein [Micromonosporaceae bacterium]